jgi:hypothetical protein
MARASIIGVPDTHQYIYICIYNPRPGQFYGPAEPHIQRIYVTSMKY